MKRDESMAAAVPVRYTKEQLMASKRYSKRRDLAAALLEDGGSYTIGEAGRIIEQYLKGKVK